MSATFRLPPSERDFEVFFKVAFHSVSTRDAAKFHNISQTRVRQLVTLVGDWVADNLPDWGEADLKKQVRLAQQVAANRLEHQYESAMRLWDVEGDPRHLRQATRIALSQARLGVVAGRVHALAADVTEGPAELGDNLPVSGAPSPDGDCSPTGDYRDSGEEGAGEDFAASDSPETLIERERRLRLQEVEGAALFESRLLSLIAGQGTANPDKVAQLTETLARVRAHKATAELRLSRFIRGVQIEPLNAQPQHTDAN
jgi:hypothetical protein